jgi:hypothetical protein
MTNEINRDRRRFLERAAMTINFAAQLAILPPAAAPLTEARTAAVQTPKPAANTSFGTLKQIEAGVLNVAYAEAGPARRCAAMTQYGANGASDARNAAACRVNEW